MSKQKRNIESISKPDFKSPPGYFEKLPGIIESRIESMETDGIKVLDIKKAPKAVPFTVPNNFFDELPMRIQSEVETSTKKRTVFIPIPQLAWAAPALILLLAIGYITLFNEGSSIKTTDELLADVTTEDLIAYLEKSDMSTEELLQEVDFVALDSEFESVQDDLLNEMDLSNDDLEDLFNEYDVSGEIL